MTLSARRLLALAALAGAGGVATAQAAASGASVRSGSRDGGPPAITRPGPDDAVRATRSAKTAKAKAKTKARKAKARAVKLSGDVAWAPDSALRSERAPLAGATGGGTTASGGGATANGGTGGATGTGGTGGGTGTTSNTPPAPDAPPRQQALGVTVDERSAYTMVLSRTTLAAGSLTIQLNNIGEDPHNLRIVRTSPGGGAATDFPDTAKQSQTTRTLTLSAGTYYLYCTLQQPQSHEAAGMHATLRVDP